MGVPSYFAWIVKLIKKRGLTNMIHKNLNGSTKRLYLDFNCLIHRACRTAVSNSEEEMINSVITVLREVIDHVKPRDLVYISIDGSVPMGKCKQQRFRRFKSVKESRDIAQIKSKYGVAHEKHPFDFNAISPGTQFMNRLSNGIAERILQWKATEPGLDYILSDSLEPGEGEHKIMRHIRSHRPSREDQIVIYGLDADLIFLSLGLHHHSTYLFRENVLREMVEDCIPDYIYLNIGDLRENIVQLIVQSDDIVQLPTRIGRCFLREITDYNADNLINDYIFINFFLGNDFVNRIYCLSIRNRGCETVLQIYRYCLRQNNDYLVKERTHRPGSVGPAQDGGRVYISPTFLHGFLDCLADYEVFYWHNPPPYHPPTIEQGISPMEKEIEQYGIVEGYLHDLQLDSSDRSFKPKYYQRLFPLYPRYSIEENIDYICRKYWSTVRWTLEYYLGNCPDWDWYYPFEYAPLIDDLLRHHRAVNNYPFKDNGPIDVHHQLMIILPPQSFHLLPPIYKRIVHHRLYSRFFPSEYDYHYYGHRFTWECPPKIPVLDSRKTQPFYEYLSRHGKMPELEQAT